MPWNAKKIPIKPPETPQPSWSALKALQPPKTPLKPQCGSVKPPVTPGSSWNHSEIFWRPLRKTQDHLETPLEASTNSSVAPYCITLNYFHRQTSTLFKGNSNCAVPGPGPGRIIFSIDCSIFDTLRWLHDQRTYLGNFSSTPHKNFSEYIPGFFKEFHFPKINECFKKFSDEFLNII